MSLKSWTTLVRPLGSEAPLWELFHENSKASSHERPLPDHARPLRDLAESLELTSYPSVPLSDEIVPPPALLGAAIAGRATPTSEPEPAILKLETLASILQYSYGAFSDPDMNQSRRRRAVDSPGFMYPLELFVHCSKVENLAAGIYHYSPTRNELRFLRRNDHSHDIAAQLRDPRLAYLASAIIFVAAVPERMVLRSGDRGYRLVLMEAGAVLQNLALVTHAWGLMCVTTAEYSDRHIDTLLGFDGLTMSTLSLVAISSVPDPPRHSTRIPPQECNLDHEGGANHE